MTKPKFRQYDELVDAPPDLLRAIDQSKFSDGAIKLELQRRFDLALYYLGVPSPSSQTNASRLFAVIDRAFPDAFQLAAKHPKKISDLQKRELARWVDDLKKIKPRQSDKAVIESGRTGKKELLSAFPWLKGNSTRTIEKLVSEGRTAERELDRHLAVLVERARLETLGLVGFPQDGGFFRKVGGSKQK